jgi:hypothetical protein
LCFGQQVMPGGSRNARHDGRSTCAPNVKPILALVTTVYDGGNGNAERLLDSIGADVLVSVVVQGVDVVPPGIVSRVGDRGVAVPAPRLSISQARNVALAAALHSLPVDGRHVLAFPDDDVVWPPDLPTTVLRAFEGGGPDFVLGTYAPTREAVDRERFPPRPCEITPAIALRRASSACLYVRISALGPERFDEGIGLGAGWPAGEDIELTLRLMSLGKLGRYDPEILVFHTYSRTTIPARRIAGLHVIAMYAMVWPSLAIPLVRGAVRWGCSLGWRERRQLARAVSSGLREAPRRRKRSTGHTQAAAPGSHEERTR